MGLASRILFMLLFMVSQASGQHYLHHDGRSAEYVFRYEQISFLAAGDSVTGLEEAKEFFRKNRFQKSTMPDLNLGIAKDNYWVHLGVVPEKKDSSRYMLSFGNPRLNEVRVFILSNDSLIYESITGDNFPFIQRSTYSHQFDFPLDLSGGDTLDIFIYFLHKGNTLQVPISIFKESAWLQQTEKSYLLIGIVTGIMLLTLLFSFFLYLNSRKKLFSLYAFYITSITFWLWSTEGFGFQFLWPDHPEIATRLGPGFSVLNLFFFMAVALEFCKPYEQGSRFRKILHASKWVVLIWGSIPFLPIRSIIVPETMAVFLSVSFSIYFLFLLLMTGYLLWVSVKKNHLVWYYFFAVVISMVGSLIVVARHSGLLELPVSSGVFMSGSVVLEVILMTAGLAKQFYQMQKEKETLLKEYLDQQVGITQTILKTQDAERKRISREMHDDIGAGLTQISLMSESAGRKISNPELENIKQTSRQLVNSLSEIIWSLNPEHKTAGQFYAYLREQLSRQLEYSGISYTMQLPENNQDTELSNELRRNILLVMREAVNNSIKYSKADKLEVQSEITEGKMICHISDNGIGFNQADERKGNGIRNMKNRVSDLGGVLDIRAEPGNGCSIRVEIPLKHTI